MKLSIVADWVDRGDWVDKADRADRDCTRLFKSFKTETINDRLSDQTHSKIR